VCVCVCERDRGTCCCCCMIIPVGDCSKRPCACCCCLSRLSWCCQGLSELSEDCQKIVKRLLWSCQGVVTGLLPSRIAKRIVRGGCMRFFHGVVRVLSSGCQGVVRVLWVGCQVVVRALSGCVVRGLLPSKGIAKKGPSPSLSLC